MSKTVARTNLPVTTPSFSFTRATPAQGRRQDAHDGTPVLTGNSGGRNRQRGLGNPLSSAAVPPIVHEVLRSSGEPLDAATRAFMEPRFAHDFTRVRVHTNKKAAQSAAAVNAEAYTVGRHIVFGENRLSSATPAGRGLLAHELAHTVQQRSVRDEPSQFPVTSPNDATEAEAHHIAESAGAGRPALPAAQTARLARATRPFFLTFDDGPDGVNKLGGGQNMTEQVLDALCDKGVQAGFFVQTAAENKGTPTRGSSSIGEKLITRINADGHKVGIHTGGKRDHEPHPKAFTAGRLAGELTSAKAAIKKLTGKTPTMVRPPFGTSTKDVRAVYKTLGLSNVLWDIDGDRKATTLKDIQANITTDLKAIIARGWTGTTPLTPTIVALFHDIRANTAKNVGAIIDFIKSETSALTKGKDTASFPSISCKPPSTELDSEFPPYGPGDYYLPPTNDNTRGAGEEMEESSKERMA
ncbi:MAG TPA: DUF4157 domain-containing protein [Chthoniobacterales bacterium]